MDEISSYVILPPENPAEENIQFGSIFKKFIEKIKCPKNSKLTDVDRFKVTFDINDGQVNCVPKKSPDNVYSSQKYTYYSFVPIVLFNQFRVFYNFYFLLISCCYFFPILRVGLWWTNWGPMIFFLTISLIREGYADYHRRVRDREVNDEKYERVCLGGESELISCKQIKPGNIIVVHSKQRVPADMILLKTNEENKGSIFIKTDQLDGETDWKLRKSAASLENIKWADFSRLDDFSLKVEEPHKDIEKFEGVVQYRGKAELLTIDNTMWASTVLAAGSAMGLVVYSGRNTKVVQNAQRPIFKASLFESEADRFAKVLFALQLATSIGLALAHGFVNDWFVRILKFTLLLSYILPVSLRINLDAGKAFYSFMINRDEKIQTTILRNLDISEELGRLSFLLTDKTGTLTLNQMNFKKLKTATRVFSREQICADQKLDENGDLAKLMLAIALCHNVTPIKSDDGETVLQGSSTDEIALVSFTGVAGLNLLSRTTDEIVLEKSARRVEKYRILLFLPFTSERKRMGILLQNLQDGRIVFLCKGAEEVMSRMVEPTHWLEEETSSLASEGLRTLVFASKRLSEEEYDSFKAQYSAANANAAGVSSLMREYALQRTVEAHLEVDMEPLGISGVEDKLRADVKTTFELLKQGGIKIWMLTGDKRETAICVAKSTGLVTRRTQVLAGDMTMGDILRLNGSLDEELKDAVLVLDGVTLDRLLLQNKTAFLSLATKIESVILCRCSPTQKALVVKLVQSHTRKRVCAVGDGGNDVGMIQVANVGIGIEGREGRSASLAADVATTEFSNITRLLLWHGRNAYIRSTSLAHLVFHRGVIFAVLQVVFTMLTLFAVRPLFTGWLVIGYTTVYTNFSVFSLVLDQDISERNIMLFPQFYHYLQDVFSRSTTSRR